MYGAQLCSMAVRDESGLWNSGLKGGGGGQSDHMTEKDQDGNNSILNIHFTTQDSCLHIRKSGQARNFRYSKDLRRLLSLKLHLLYCILVN